MEKPQSFAASTLLALRPVSLKRSRAVQKGYVDCLTSTDAAIGADAFGFLLAAENA
jgi:hypothetical protein